MTTSWIAKHLTDVSGSERIVIPGLCEGDVRAIEDRWGVQDGEGARRPPGPAGALRPGGAPRGVRRPRHPDLRRDQQRPVSLARGGRAHGGVLPGGRRRRRRPRLLAGPEVRRRRRGRGPPEERAGFTLSIDTLDPVEIAAADRAGVDYVLSLNGQNLDVADTLRATPVLIPDTPAELDTLDRSIARLERARPSLHRRPGDRARRRSASRRRSTATSRSGRATPPSRS